MLLKVKERQSRKKKILIAWPKPTKPLLTSTGRKITSLHSLLLFVSPVNIKVLRELLIATKNKGKFEEFFGILQDLPFKFLTLNNLRDKIPSDFNIKETGKTFEENAILKAKAWGKLTGLLTLSDDSGLRVDYLNGEPGVKSHRFTNGSDKDRYKKLLKIMNKVPVEKRRAIFVSIIALFDPETSKVKITNSECKGRIAFVPKGTHGFGYDPIFIVKGLNRHFAELTLKEKNQISHRAKALKKMKKILSNFYNT